MKKIGYVVALLAVAVAGCGAAPSAGPIAQRTETTSPTETPTAIPTNTASPSITPPYPTDGYGPVNFPVGMDPLTGQTVRDPALLQRRPMLIKVSNLPRNVRPQWGLSLADIVFEYYAEEGTTRFAAIFYGQDASKVGPIRSGRFIDDYLVQGYKAVFAFGSAYVAERNRFNASDYAKRMVMEGPGKPLTRYDPNGYDYLMVNTAELGAYATKQGFNGVQNLDGMSFKLDAAAGGQPGTQVYMHYSGAIYDRWDYDTASGSYLRFSDTANVTNIGQNEQYAQLTDRLTGQALAIDNVVILYVIHDLYSPGIYDILLSGSGDGVAFRDGQAYTVRWRRNQTEVVALTLPDGSPYPFKPGNTWFEVIGLQSKVSQTGGSWQFMHAMP